MASRRWGMLGGIFDPIHYAHLAIAEQCAEALRLDGVVFMPAGQPVHRDAPRASADERVRMIELATTGNERFSVSRLEIDSDRPSYSFETAEQLKATRPDDDLVFIASAEAASYLPQWRNPERLLEVAHFAVVPRLGHADLPLEWIEHHFPGRAARFTFVETTRLGHSSSDIRARLAAGRSIRYLVPDAVATHIGERHLYESEA